MKDKWKEGKVKVEVFLYPEEFEILKRRAEHENLSYSEKMRLAFMWDAVSDGDKEAIKLTAKRGLQKIWDKFKKPVEVKLVYKGQELK